MKKLFLFGMLAVAMCSLSGCKAKDPGEEAADQVIEFKEDAREAVSEQNQDVWEMEEAAKQLEDEME